MKRISVWMSMYDQSGRQFGRSFETDTTDPKGIYQEMLQHIGPDEDIADYGYFEDDIMGEIQDVVAERRAIEGPVEWC